jgi:hypothetical protein
MGHFEKMGAIGDCGSRLFAQTEGDYAKSELNFIFWG